MKINEPLSDNDHARADSQHRAVAENQVNFLNEVAELVATGQVLTGLQREWAAGAIRGFAAGIPLERKRPPGKTPKIPAEAIVLRQVYISSGNSVTEAEQRLAELYDVDVETLQSRIKRLTKEIAPASWGFKKWGAN